MSMGERFRELRTSLGLNQKGFADRLGISQTYVSSIENGKEIPSTSLIKLMCMKTNMSENWLVNGIGSPFNKIEYTTEDKSIIEDYESLRNRLDKTISNLSKTDLVNAVNAFRSFVRLIDQTVDGDDLPVYLDSISNALNSMNTLIYQSSIISLPKNEPQKWLYYKNECYAKIDEITKNVKVATNLFLSNFVDEMKFPISESCVQSK
jgi:transcriptional regulator with XRE-family HTH domain